MACALPFRDSQIAFISQAMLSPTLHTVDVSGRRIAYHLVNNKGNIVLLFCHGASLAGMSWLPVMEALSSLNDVNGVQFDLACIDLSNHGLSSPSLDIALPKSIIALPPFDFSGKIADADTNKSFVAYRSQVQLLERLNGQHSHLLRVGADDLLGVMKDIAEKKGGEVKFKGIGHSMGGVMLLIAATDRPDLFNQLIMHEPVFMLDPLFDALPLRPIQLSAFSSLFDDKQWALKCLKFNTQTEAIKKNVQRSYYGKLEQQLLSTEKINDWLRVVYESQPNMSLRDREVLKKLVSPSPSKLSKQEVADFFSKYVLPLEFYAELNSSISSLRVFKRADNWSTFANAKDELLKRSILAPCDPRVQKETLKFVLKNPQSFSDSTFRLYPSASLEASFYSNWHNLVGKGLKVSIPMVITTSPRPFEFTPDLYLHVQKQLCPQFSLQVIDNADHFFPFTKPDAFAAIVAKQIEQKTELTTKSKL